MTQKTLVLTVVAALAAAALAAGCNSVLGFKDPRLEQGSGSGDPMDAAIDAKMDDAMMTDASTACPASCDPFGCETGTTTCRPKKLWVFLTTGAFTGNGIAARGGADAKCFTRVNTDFNNRGCVAARTHAIITFDGADDIQGMSAHFSIPNVAVHRADDDVMVFASWSDLITTGKAPLASDVANTTSDGTAWSGFGAAAASKCQGWTTNAAAEEGTIAETKAPPQPGLWLGRIPSTCNLLRRLLCVCWAGG